jgi:hypothetical protein
VAANVRRVLEGDMLEKLTAESWTAKLLHIAAFVTAACGTYFLLLPLHHWVSATYPALDNLVVGILVSFVLIAPVYPLEERFLRRFTERDITQYPSPQKAFRPIKPVSMGILVGCVVLYGASSHA